MIIAAIAGGGAAVAFILRAVARAAGVGSLPGPPMLPLDIFASRQFTVINVITFCVYAAFGGELFLLVLELQVAAGFSALAAGSALLPIPC